MTEFRITRFKGNILGAFNTTHTHTPIGIFCRNYRIYYSYIISTKITTLLSLAIKKLPQLLDEIFITHYILCNHTWPYYTKSRSFMAKIKVITTIIIKRRNDNSYTHQNFLQLKKKTFLLLLLSFLTTKILNFFSRVVCFFLLFFSKKTNIKMMILA